MDAEDWDRLPDRFGVDPADHAQWQELIAALRRAVQSELTERQRRVFVAIVAQRRPARRPGHSSSARTATRIYKTMFDARRKFAPRLSLTGT